MGNPIESIIGAIVKGAQTVAETEADNAAMAIQSREWNRAMASEKERAVDSLTRGATAAGQQRMRTTSVLGEQRLSYAMGNIDSTSGTAAQTADSTRIYGELDAATTMNNARREALGHTAAVTQLEEQGRAASLARKNRDIERGMSVVGSILNIAGSAGGMSGKDKLE